jgi:DNA polymerase-3 subunit beta
MRVSILQESLAKGLGVVGRAVSPRTPLPVLNNVLLATESGRLRISATDLELGITTWLGANVEEEGATTVPARTFNDLVNQLSPERVDMETAPEGNKLRLACGSNTANINVMSADEFPVLPEPGEHDDTLTIPATDLRHMIRQVAFAAASDENRPILTGVLLQYEAGVLTMAAADGFRLAVRSLRLDVDFPEFDELVVPAKALVELERIAADEDKDVYMVLPPDRGQVLFHMTNAALVTQIIEGSFPDYNQIIPRDSSTTRTELDTAEFLRACKRAEIFARESPGNTVSLHIQPHESMAGTVTISATAADKGDNEGVLAAHIEGEEVEVAFNVRYMMEALGVLDDERVMLETINSRSPGVMHPTEGNGMIYVIMPMHMGR